MYALRAIRSYANAPYSLFTRSIPSFALRPRQLSGKNWQGFSDNIELQLRDGYPCFKLPLASRQGTVLLHLNPVTDTVGSVVSHIKQEDPGLEQVELLTPEGDRLALSSPVRQLLYGNFDLQLNDKHYRVNVSDQLALIPGTDAGTRLKGELGEVKNAIHRLYVSLNVDRHQLQLEQELKSRAEVLNEQLRPFEEAKAQLEQKAWMYTHACIWGGLGVMGVNAGLVGYLTWFVLSWDIVEPFSYIITFSTSILFYTYFVLSRQDPSYPDARSRIFYLNFYRAARKQNFSVAEYNSMKTELESVKKRLDTFRSTLS